MKKYACDVCGVEILEGGNAPLSSASELCELEDLCPCCGSFARDLDAQVLVLEALRRMAGAPRGRNGRPLDVKQIGRKLGAA